MVYKDIKIIKQVVGKAKRSSDFHVKCCDIELFIESPLVKAATMNIINYGVTQ